MIRQEARCFTEIILGYKVEIGGPLFKIKKGGPLGGLKKITRAFSAEGAEFILTQNYAHHKQKIFSFDVTPMRVP